MQNIYLTLLKHEQTLASKYKVRTKNSYPINAVHYIVSGRGYFNGKLLKKGDGFVCLKNATVEYYPDPSDPWAYYWCQFEGAVLNTENCFFDEQACTFRFAADDTFFSCISFIQNAQEQYMNNPVFSAGCASLMLSRHIRSAQPKPRNFQSRRHVEIAKNYIDSNYNKPLTMNEIASVLHISRAYLRNIFSKYEGISPQKYLISVRINRAKELLKTKDATISEIAASVGYQDPIQFYKIFKSHTGVTASDYPCTQTKKEP